MFLDECNTNLLQAPV